jgi:hypothetical protein
LFDVGMAAAWLCGKPCQNADPPGQVNHFLMQLLLVSRICAHLDMGCSPHCGRLVFLHSMAETQCDRAPQAIFAGRLTDREIVIKLAASVVVKEEDDLINSGRNRQFIWTLNR